MFKTVWKDWAMNPATKEKADFVFDSHLTSRPETLVGCGLLVVGLLLTLNGAWKAGLYDHEIGEIKALESIGIILGDE